MKKALILDLDNTIYPVSSIGSHLFAGLFAILDQHADQINSVDITCVDKIKDEMSRRPFQHIADEFNLDRGIRAKMVDALKNMSYDLPMHPFHDYQHIRSVPLEKFLVTTGFSKLQWSKVKMLGIEEDFQQIHIVDPEVSQLTKKDIFEEIMHIHHYYPNQLLVIGDDPQSEIKAANALGIDTVLYDPGDKYRDSTATHRISNFKKIADLLS